MTQDEKTPESAPALADLAFLARAFADENRLRIIRHLGVATRTVSQIGEDLGLSQPLVSHHLRELKRALLVDVQRRGPFVHYSLKRPEILDVLHSMAALAENLLAERKGFQD